MTDINTLKSEIIAGIEKASSLSEIEDIRVGALGKKGSITGLMKTIGALSIEEKKTFGAQVNILKEEIAALIDAKKEELETAEINRKIAVEKIDVTLPVREETMGRIHPLYQAYDELLAIFASMGFTLAEGPDIETDYYNFEALNVPKDHPARQMQDTFFIEGDGGILNVLRTQTSAVQIRSMENNKPPIKIVVPGRTYRVDYDMTHTPMFHQIEGLVIDKATNMGHLKGCLEDVLKAYFEIDTIKLRFRPSFFPFTEPSAEVDIACSWDNGVLKIGDEKGWMEMLGCGIGHPNVLETCGIDPEEYQGFAFGMGLDRLAMLKYGIPDLRHMFEFDLRWIKHYGFSGMDIPSPSMGLSLNTGVKR